MVTKKRAELVNCRHENFCSPILRAASVESTRIYEKLVAKKVKDTPQIRVIRVVVSKSTNQNVWLTFLAASMNCHIKHCSP